MTITGLIQKAKFWLDKTNSPRFNNGDLLDALMSAEDSMIKETLFRSRGNKASQSFQINQRVRDELGNLVLDDEIAIVNNIVPRADFPVDFNHHVSLRVKTAASDYDYFAFPVAYAEEKYYKNNPFKRAGSTEMVYFIESNAGYRIIVNSTEETSPTFITAKLYYIKKMTRLSLEPVQTSELPENMHEELAIRGAINMLIIVGQYEKANRLFQEIMER